MSDFYRAVITAQYRTLSYFYGENAQLSFDFVFPTEPMKQRAKNTIIRQPLTDPHLSRAPFHVAAQRDTILFGELTERGRICIEIEDRSMYGDDGITVEDIMNQLHAMNPYDHIMAAVVAHEDLGSHSYSIMWQKDEMIFEEFEGDNARIIAEALFGISPT